MGFSYPNKFSYPNTFVTQRCSDNGGPTVVLVHIIHKTVLNTTKHLQVAGYKVLKIVKNSNFSLTASLPHTLPDHSHKPRAQTKQCTVTILRHNNRLTSEMCLLGFRQVYALCTLSFLLSSIRLVVFFFKHQNHTEALIFHINTFL